MRGGGPLPGPQGVRRNVRLHALVVLNASRMWFHADVQDLDTLEIGPHALEIGPLCLGNRISMPWRSRSSVLEIGFQCLESRALLLENRVLYTLEIILPYLGERVPGFGYRDSMPWRSRLL